jgi:hypothetical protein
MPTRPNPMAGAVFTAVPLPESVRAEMIGVSWHTGCPVPLDDLALLTVTHMGFDRKPHTGELVVHKNVADELLAIFRSLYARKYPIEKIRRIEAYGGDDMTSMQDDNTSAFNCRVIAGTSRLSRHAYGLAIDVNPLYNPYVKGDDIQPPEGAAYLDRSRDVKGMIHAEDICRREFMVRGWDWGGDWESRKDYQHFEKKAP